MNEAPVKYGEHQTVPLGAVCEVCGGDLPVTDHCHQHGWVRGLVCTSCNARMSFVDRHIAPKVEAVLLAALLALWHRCPDCGQLDVTDLAAGMPRAPRPAVKNINIRYTDELHALVKASADADRRSLNSQIAWLLEAGLANRDKKRPQKTPREETP